ncbi:MAG: alginate export family protein [Methyloprofundus sp.]|nr:alginate export family protein [Methyloprofundus sp.]
MPTSAQATNIDNSVENALFLGQQGEYGQIKFDLRYRYENVHITNDLPVKTANANTLRLRAGYLTPDFFNLQAYIEYEGNLAMQEDFNSLRNGYTHYETVADPQVQELNQFWLTYKGIPGTLIKGGRQRIELDNERFIGNDDWRQMEQTFDSLLISNQSISNLTLNFIYIGQVQTVISTLQTINLPILNFSYQFGRFSTLTGYAYWLADYDHAENSTQTYGVRMHGAPRLKHDIRLSYDIGYSNQGSYKNNPASYNLDRYNILLGATYVGITLKSGMEQLNGNGTYAFQTPLGTNHGFQGWADKFLLTPTTGVRDIQATIDKSFYGVKFMFAYHYFSSSSGNGEYGDEYDFLVSKRFGEHYQLLAKYAYYNADNSSAATQAGVDQDTQKIWVQGSVSF